jgi:hypothetical protein
MNATIAVVSASCVILAALLASPTAAFSPMSSGFVGRPTLRQTVSQGLRVPKLRIAQTPNAVPSINTLRMAATDEAQIITSGGAGGYFT